jgi:hypothetical protein
MRLTGGEAAGREADHSPPSSAEAKNAWSYTFTPQYAFMAWCSVKAQEHLYLYHEDVWDSGGIAPGTLNLVTR